MSHSSAFDRLRRIFSAGMRDPHEEKHAPDYRESHRAPEHPRGTDRIDSANPSPLPSHDARTDPARGTGELGEEDLDPGRPLAP
jgi:hypothetical protein